LNKRLTKFSEEIVAHVEISDKVKLAMISVDKLITRLNYVIENNNKLPVEAVQNR